VDLGSNLGFDIGGTLSKLVFIEPLGDVGPYMSKLARIIVGENNSHYGSTGVRDEQLSFLSTDVEGSPGAGGGGGGGGEDGEGSSGEGKHDASGGSMGGGGRGRMGRRPSADGTPTGCRFHFIRFETERMAQAFQMIRARGGHENVNHLYVAGGGATKYGALAQKELGIEFIPMDEIGTIVKALAFVVNNVQDEIYSLENVSFDNTAPLVRTPRPTTPDYPLFPFLLCNIGSGVSIVRVESVDHYERVSGTALGGGMEERGERGGGGGGHKWK
jgi:pantothenate kinase